MRRGLVILESRNDDEFGGIIRVLRVLAKIPADTLRKVGNVQDHKGCLVVTWADAPTEHDMGCFETEWDREHECILQYNMPDHSVVDVQVGVTVRTPVE